MKTKKINIRALCVASVMGALGALLMLLEFPLPILIPSFIKLDFSELPALITTFAFGPFWGIAVCLIKNLLHLFAGNSAGIGELSNFILGSVFVFTAGIIYKKNRTRKSALTGALLGSVITGIVCIFTNYYIIYPLYSKILALPTEVIISMYSEILPSVNTLFAALLIFNLPFTVIKGFIDTLLCFLMYKPLSPLIKGNKK